MGVDTATPGAGYISSNGPLYLNPNGKFVGINQTNVNNNLDVVGTVQFSKTTMNNTVANLKCADNNNGSVQIFSSLQAGAYNGIVQVGDCAVIGFPNTQYYYGSNPWQPSNAFVLAPWTGNSAISNPVSCGIRMVPATGTVQILGNTLTMGNGLPANTTQAYLNITASADNPITATHAITVNLPSPKQQFGFCQGVDYGSGQSYIRYYGLLGTFNVACFVICPIPSTTPGCVSINTTVPNYNYALSVNGSVYCTGSFVSSDYRIKDKVIDMHHKPSLFHKLRPVHYYNTKNKKSEHGFIAHEVKELYPDMVMGEKDDLHHESNEPQLQAINYNEFTCILVHEVQKLIKTVNKLQADIKELQKIKI